MVSFNKFIQEGGFNNNQKGGFNYTELFNAIIINDMGVYDKKSFKEIEITETSKKTDLTNNIKILNISNKKINLGIDRILYGDVEDIEPIYSIQINFMDYKDIINVEGEECANNYITNYGNVITYLNKMSKKQSYQLDAPIKQTIRVY